VSDIYVILSNFKRCEKQLEIYVMTEVKHRIRLRFALLKFAKTQCHQHDNYTVQSLLQQNAINMVVEGVFGGADCSQFQIPLYPPSCVQVSE
jgi:hypothetical protein